MVSARPRAASVSYLTDTLPTALPPIFDQVQNTTANHRKNIVALRKVQESCAGVTERNGKGQKKLIGEKAFNTAFIDMVNRVLPVKKGVGQADRVVKFVAGYVGYATELESKDAEADSDEETFTTRFIGKLLRHLLAGMDAKDKNVRFRVTLMTVSMINGLGEIDDDMYLALRKALLDRSRDKETAVRVQAALGLSKLQSGEDPDDLEDGEEPLGDVLLDILRYDPAAEVRRAAIYNLPRNPATLPHIIARTRDIDPTLRRTVYHGSLSAANLPDARVLTIAQREEIVRNGLGDREGSVRKAAAGMLGGWVEGAEGDLIQFLSRFDVMSSGEVAEEALMSLFVTRPEILDTIELTDAFWAELSPEKAFLARVFGEHLRAIKDDVRFEDSMPVVTALAFKTQDEYNTLAALHAERQAQMIDEEEQAGEDKKQAAVDERAFVVGELLKLGVWLDYSDETGRRKMFQLTREMISQPNLPQTLVPRCLDVLTKISDGERDLIRVIVDVITELRQGEWDEEPLSSQASAMGTPAPSRMTPAAGEEDPEAKWKKVIIDIRCLEICISLLERVNSPLHNNSVFHGLVPDLIIPSVTNKEEPALRESGMIALGLCCMIDLDMAKKSIALLMNQLNAAQGPLKVKVAQIVFDLMMVHDTAELFDKALTPPQVVEMINAVLHMPDEEVQAVAVEGVAKLMLAGMMYDDALLHALVALYFSPETAENQAVRQCLTYFLPVFCYSSPENQRRLAKIFPDCYELFGQLAEEWDGDRDLVPVSTMGLMLVDWLDPFKVVEREGVKADYGVHLDLCIEILKLVMTEETKDSRKTLVSLLGKLNLPEGEETEAWKIQAVSVLLASIRSKCPLSDSISKNALNKFDVSLQKKYMAELDGFDMDAFGTDDDARQEVKDLVDFIDAVEEREDASAAGSPKKRRARRGVSEAPTEMTDVVSDEDDDDDGRSTVKDGQSDEDATPKAKRTNGARGGGKGRRRVGTVDTEEGDEDDDVESMLGE